MTDKQIKSYNIMLKSLLWLLDKNLKHDMNRIN